MPHGAVLHLAGTPDDGALAVTLNSGRVTSEVGNQLAAQLFAERAQLI